MGTTVTLPDGKTASFPAGMNQQQIQDALDADPTYGIGSVGARPGVPPAPLPAGLQGPATPPSTLQKLENYGQSAISNIGNRQQNELNDSEQNFKNGNYAQGVSHALSYAIPLVGPDIGDASRSFEQGKYLKGAGQSLATAASVVGPEGAAGLYDAARPAATDAAKGIITRLIKPNSTDLSFGKDAAEGVLSQPGGARSWSLEGLGDRIAKNKVAIGKQIEPVVASAPQTPIDVSDLIHSPIRGTIRNAASQNEQQLVGRLSDFRRSLTDNLAPNSTEDGIISTGPRDLTKQTPLDVLHLKQQVGNGTRWTNQAFDNDLNATKGAVYGGLKQSLSDAVPEIAPLNRQYGNLTAADNAIQRRIPVAGRNNIFSLSDTAAGIGTGMASGNPLFAGSVLAGKKAINSTPFKTAVADGLFKFGNGPSVGVFTPPMASAIPPIPIAPFRGAAPAALALSPGLYGSRKK